MKRITYILSILALSAVVFACSADSKSSGPSGGGGEGGGTGGSMARFTILGDYVYTVDNNRLKTAYIGNPAHPKAIPGSTQNLGFGIETIFPYDRMLFIGSQTGMYIYDVVDPASPKRLSYTSHFTSCDPVVASGNYAYVTLNSDNANCGRGADELQVYDISDIKNPSLIFNDRTIRTPKGLGVDAAAAKLFVCYRNGVKVYDITDPANPVVTDEISNVEGVDFIRTYDLIPLNGLFILVGPDGLYQFDYTTENIRLISKITLERK